VKLRVTLIAPNQAGSTAEAVQEAVGNPNWIAERLSNLHQLPEIEYRSPQLGSRLRVKALDGNSLLCTLWRQQNRAMPRFKYGSWPWIERAIEPGPIVLASPTGPYWDPPPGRKHRRFKSLWRSRSAYVPRFEGFRRAFVS
jgi:hypothetical protein